MATGFPPRWQEMAAEPVHHRIQGKAGQSRMGDGEEQAPWGWIAR